MKKILLMLLMSALVFSCEILNTPLEEGETASLVGKALFLNQADNSGIVISVEKTDGLRSISSGSRSVVASTTTDSDGSYTIENLEAGTYTLYASSKDSSEKAVSRNNVVVDTRVVTVDDLYLTPVGSVEGIILVDGSTDDSIGTLISIAGTSYMSTASAIGEFVISDVPVGSDYTLVMTKGIDLYIMENTISVSAGEVTEVGSINITLSNNQQGETPIVGIEWQGSLTEAPANPKTNWAYYNEVEGISYIYDGYEWQIIAQDGSDGQDGADGQSTYDLWLSLGNVGSEQDFIDNIVGSGEEEPPVEYDDRLEDKFWKLIINYKTYDLNSPVDQEPEPFNLYYNFQNGIGSLIHNLDADTYYQNITLFYQISGDNFMIGMENGNWLETYEYSIDNGTSLLLISSGPDEDDNDNDGNTTETIYNVVEFELMDQDYIDGLNYSCEVDYMHIDYEHIDETYASVGDLLTSPEVPVKEGFVFIGWFTDRGLTNEWDFENETVSSAMILYAGFTPEV